MVHQTCFTRVVSACRASCRGVPSSYTCSDLDIMSQAWYAALHAWRPGSQGPLPTTPPHTHTAPALCWDMPQLLPLTVHIQGVGCAQSISGSEKSCCLAQGGPAPRASPGWGCMAILAVPREAGALSPRCTSAALPAALLLLPWVSLLATRPLDNANNWCFSSEGAEEAWGCTASSKPGEQPWWLAWPVDWRHLLVGSGTDMLFSSVSSTHVSRVRGLLQSPCCVAWPLGETGGGLRLEAQCPTLRVYHLSWESCWATGEQDETPTSRGSAYVQAGLQLRVEKQMGGPSSESQLLHKPDMWSLGSYCSPLRHTSWICKTGLRTLALLCCDD